MRTILAIAAISIRNAIRSKLVIVLIAFLLLVLIGLPLTIRGDGTLTGHVRLLLQYTLGLAMLILSVATVWASCAAISSEIRDRQIQMVLAKPVQAAQLWLGKWLGLTVLNGGLLLICAIGTYAALQWTTRPSQLLIAEQQELAREILIAHRPIAADEIDLSAEIERQYRAARERGEWPAEIPTREVLPQIERAVRAQANAVAPGQGRRWTFNLPRIPPSEEPLLLRYRFSTSVFDMEPIDGVWLVGDPARPDRERIEVEHAQRTTYTVPLDPSALNANQRLTLEFQNHNREPVTVIFNPAELHVLIPQGTFLGNYIKATLLLMIHLSFLAAIGLTAGAFLSVPVAALASFYFLLMLNAGRFIGRLAAREIHLGHHHTEPGLISQVFAAASQVIYSALNLLIQPVYATNPLVPVAAGEWVSAGRVGYDLIVKVVVYSGVLLLFSVWHLRRKEVALPT